ncbi:MAG: DUF4352 domain-containing protein [Chloroflexi bacterium]|nr:MAG: DUF4352 domain-containing protein [Chloroflexota bacterium]
MYPPGPPEEEYYDDADYEYDDDEYYDEEDEDNPWLKRGIIFLGGCLVLLACLGCCVLLLVLLWFVDPTQGLLATPIPGSDIGLSLDAPAYSNESVVNEQKVKLTILELYRDASVPAIPPQEDREVIIITVELVNLGDEDVNFNERDFALLNLAEEAYLPTPGAIDGALGRGILPPDSGLEGRLVFEVARGEQGLTLRWDGGPDAEPRFIALE